MCSADRTAVANIYGNAFQNSFAQDLQIQCLQENMKLSLLNFSQTTDNKTG